jgi:hypothetical protein
MIPVVAVSVGIIGVEVGTVGVNVGTVGVKVGTVGVNVGTVDVNVGIVKVNVGTVSVNVGGIGLGGTAVTLFPLEYKLQPRATMSSRQAQKMDGSNFFLSIMLPPLMESPLL